MCKKEVGDFVVRAEELIIDALMLSRANDATLELPQPEKSIHELTQFTIMSFVSVTKILICLFRFEEEEVSPHDAD